MKPSRKFLSLPIVSLREGQHIGYVKNLVLDPRTKSVAALVIDPKGFFRDQRIIPFGKIISVGDDAITIDRENHVDRSANIPEILTLLKENAEIIGTKIISETGKTLGIAMEYYVDPESGTITQIELSGGRANGLLNGSAWLNSENILTIGQDAIIVRKGSEDNLTIAGKGLNNTLKSLLHSASQTASETTQTVSGYFKKKASDRNHGETIDVVAVPDEESCASLDSATENINPPEGEQSDASPSTKEPLG